jgi:hypothetical protein
MMQSDIRERLSDVASGIWLGGRQSFVYCGLLYQRRKDTRVQIAVNLTHLRF